VTEPSADLRAGCRRAQLVGVVLVITIGVYALVLGRIAAEHAPFVGFAPSVDLRLLRVVFAVVAVADLVVLRIVTQVLVARRGLPAAPAPWRGSSPVTRRLFAVSIVRLAICEAIAILGVVLFLLGGRPADFYGFAAASLAVFAFHFPRLSQWEDWARQAPT
jgi:hypothetical protein